MTSPISTSYAKRRATSIARLFVLSTAMPGVVVLPRRRHVLAMIYRMPGNMPFIERIIFCMPPLATIFIIFWVCSNWLSSRFTS
jgi:hypothetical protein